MVPARLAFIDHLSEKRTRLYRELLTGHWEPDEKLATAGKVDVIFESRSRDIEGNGDGDPEGEVHRSNSTTVEHSDSQHADSGDDIKCNANNLQPKSGDQVLNAQGTEMLKTVNEVKGDDNPKGCTPNVNLQVQHAPVVLNSEISQTNQCDPWQGKRNHQLVDKSAALPKATPVVYEANVVVNANAALDTKAVSAKPEEKKTTVTRQNPPPNAKRNVFAKVACSFDDAVSKAVSNVKSLVACTGGDGQFDGAIDMGMGRFKSASVLAPSSDGTYFDYESQRKAASYCVMYRTSLGWIIANQSCSQCQMPMMVRPDDGELLCVVCDETDVMDNATLGTIPHSVESDHKTSTNGGITSAVDTYSGNKTKPIDPEPDGCIPHLIEPGPNAVIPANKAKPIDPEPLDTLENCSMINHRSTKSNHVFASDSISLGPTVSVAGMPPIHTHNEVNRRWGTSNGEIRPALPPTNAHQQWLIGNQVCPRCHLPMTRSAYENKEHCRSCGMIFYDPARTDFFAGPKAISNNHIQEVSLLDNDSNAGMNSGDVNPFSLAHQMMISSQPLKHHEITANPKQQQSFGRLAFDTQNNVAPSKLTHAGLSSFSQNPLTHSLKPAHQQSYRSVEPPTPNRMRAQFNAPTPNANRMKRNEPQHIYRNLEVKENSYGEANMGYQKKPLTAVEEAMIRMEKAQNATRTKHLHY